MLPVRRPDAVHRSSDGVAISLALVSTLAACGVTGSAAQPSTTSTTSTSDASAVGVGGTSTLSSSVLASGVGGFGLTPNLPPAFTVSGTVVDQDGAAVAGAIVLQGGRSDEPTVTSASDGSFTLLMSYGGEGSPTAVATKLGYRTAGVELLQVPQDPIELRLIAVKPPDNEGYSYGKPGHGKDPSTAFCGHCHDTFAAQFQLSKHAQAGKNPRLHDLYAGVSPVHPTKTSCEAAGGKWQTGLKPGSLAEPISKCYLGGGVLPELNPQCGGSGELACDNPQLDNASKPTAFGACADCHSPGMAGKAGGRNLHDADPLAYDNGVHCDFCHKVADVDLSLPPGAGQRLRVQRPSETLNNQLGGPVRQVMFGPLIDVPNPLMGASHQPKFSSAEFCAGCHEQTQAALIAGESLAPRFAAGVPVHSTYGEWLAGPYSAAGVPCQHCHMPANYGLAATTDLATESNASITFGFVRPAEQIRQHIFRGPLVRASPQGPRLIDTALVTVLDAAQNGGNLDVTVTLGNQGCGHAVPTGEPMRALILIVAASCNGAALAANGGMTVNDVGGFLARAVIGTEATIKLSTLEWASAAKIAQAGNVVRVVRPTGLFHDYDGVGLFAATELTPSEKGMPIHEPIAEAKVVATTAGAIELDASPALQNGDIVFLGDTTVLKDGDNARAFAGAAGYTFARVTLDAQGNRRVPHYRATDLASDNRIAPTKPQKTTHRFLLPKSCESTTAKVTAKVVYRPIPLDMAALRGWDARDYLIAHTTTSIAIP